MKAKCRLDATVTRRVVCATLAAGIACLAPASGAQSFSSGSDGSDGALQVGGATTIVFNPNDTARWGRVLDPDGDGVYHFTSITIDAGTTLVIDADTVCRPLYWLASGAVNIRGTLNISGRNAVRRTDKGLRRLLAVGGPGGETGGAGGNVASGLPATRGDGPAGGAAGTIGNLACSPSFWCGNGGGQSTNKYLIPLTGGSGGGGAYYTGAAELFDGGGGGGGAILIASSVSITLDLSGNILAQGGDGASQQTGGGGGGGSVRLVAPTIAGAGVISTRGGNFGEASASVGSNGSVRIEAFNGGEGLRFDGASVTRGSPVDPSTLRPVGSVRVVAVGGVAVAANTGSFIVPDATISTTAAVPIDIEATGIPPGTVVTLQVYPQSPEDLGVVYLPAVQAVLNGTLERSTAMATFVFPYGFSRGTVRATW